MDNEINTLLSDEKKSLSTSSTSSSSSSSSSTSSSAASSTPSSSLVVPVDSPVVIGVAWALMKDYSPNTIPTWHTNDHLPYREAMRMKLSQLIQQRRPNPTLEWLEKLNDVCLKLDDRLYYQARNFEEYNDPNTLLER